MLVSSLAASAAAVAASAVVALLATDVVHGATVVHIRITSKCSNSICTSMAATQSLISVVTTTVLTAYVTIWQRLSRSYQ
jgi:hypothetical protein